MTIKAIAAVSKNMVIGSNGGIPWNYPEDLKHVSNLTRGHYLLMGRKTYESLPEKLRPLPARHSIIITSANINSSPLIFVASNIQEGLKIYENRLNLDQDLWIFGGGAIYSSTMSLWEELYLTRVDVEVSGDTFFPELDSTFKLVDSRTSGALTFQKYIRLT